MDRVLTDWQKAVNAIAHALNKAGFDGDSPESKALELLAGRCEGTANAKTIARVFGIGTSYRVQRKRSDGWVTIGQTSIEELLAPLLSTRVDVRGLEESEREGG